MNDYPQETIDKAAAILPVNLRYLFLELELYLDLCGPEFVYTNELSIIWRRLGECEVQAGLLSATDVIQRLEELEIVLENLRTDYRVARYELKNVVNSFGIFISELDNDLKAPISVGDYKEK